MTQAATTWADSDVGIEVAITGPPRSVGVRAYTQLLEQVLLSLEEVDRFAVPGPVARIEWAVADLSVNGALRAVIAPRRVPPRRPVGTVATPAAGFVNGVSLLRKAAEIPPLFSPTTVERVEHIGKPVGAHGIESVEIRPTGWNLDRAIVDVETVDHARKAIATARRTYGSVLGRLDVLSARTRSGLRAQVLNEETRRAVTVRAAPDQGDLLREAWGKRVLVGGELQRNAAGQPIRLDLTELSILPEREAVSAWDILGVAPNWTGDMTTEEFVRRARRD